MSVSVSVSVSASVLLCACFCMRMFMCMCMYISMYSYACVHMNYVYANCNAMYFIIHWIVVYNVSCIIHMSFMNLSDFSLYQCDVVECLDAFCVCH